MKAVVYKSSKSHDVFSVQNVEEPVIKDNEILVKVHAATVTPSDLVGMGSLSLIRFFSAHARPKCAIPGVEFAGVVDAVGASVKKYKAGDTVFGSSAVYGAWAEYICVPEEGVIGLKPSNMDYKQAAGICDGALTAFHFLMNKAQIKNGQSVLVNGASGAVGTYAVQLASHFGADVTGVCSASNVELVKALGASSVIDYTKEDFTLSGKTYDIIFDAVGKSSFSYCERSLKQNGMYLCTVPSPGILVKTLLTKNKSGKKAIFTATGLSNRSGRLKALHFLTKLFEDGTLKSVTDHCYTLEQTADACRYVAKGHKKGNVLITMQ